MLHAFNNRTVRQYLSLMAITALFTLLSACGGGDSTPQEPVKTEPVANINSDYDDGGPEISSDGLALYFQSNRAGGEGGFDIYVAQRANTTDAWGTPKQLGPGTINTNANEVGSSIAADGLTLIFSADRTTPNAYDLYIATRTSVADDWGTAVRMGSIINTEFDEGGPSLSSDGLTLFFHSDRKGGRGLSDIYMATRSVPTGPWDSVANLATINSTAFDVAPEISQDGLTLYFHSDRAGGLGQLDIWVSKRASKNAPWGKPSLMPEPINSIYIEAGPGVSPDNKIIYFGSNRPGSNARDIWHSNL